jgi:hypothetical protein
VSKPRESQIKNPHRAKHHRESNEATGRMIWSYTEQNRQS